MNNQDISESLIKKAIFIADEPAWKKDDAFEIVKYLKINGYAVLGIEIWERVEDSIRVVGWSEYDIAFDGNWSLFIELNAQHALQDIEKSETNELINITWLSRKEFESPS